MTEQPAERKSDVPPDPSVTASDVTRLVAASGRGETDARDELMGLVFAELRSIAAWHMRGESTDHTLSPPALISET